MGKTVSQGGLSSCRKRKVEHIQREGGYKPNQAAETFLHTWKSFVGCCRTLERRGERLLEKGDSSTGASSSNPFFLSSFPYTLYTLSRLLHSGCELFLFIGSQCFFLHHIPAHARHRQSVWNWWARYTGMAGQRSRAAAQAAAAEQAWSSTGREAEQWSLYDQHRH